MSISLHFVKQARFFASIAANRSKILYLINMSMAALLSELSYLFTNTPACYSESVGLDAIVSAFNLAHTSLINLLSFHSTPLLYLLLFTKASQPSLRMKLRLSAIIYLTNFLYSLARWRPASWLAAFTSASFFFEVTRLYY